MTREEMLIRIDEEGGLTPETALKISIEKWEKLKFLSDIEDKNYPSTENCALCELYLRNENEVCPLNRNKEPYCQGICSFNYTKATTFIIYGYLYERIYAVAFEESKSDLIKEMKTALNKILNEKEKEIFGE